MKKLRYILSFIIICLFFEDISGQDFIEGIVLNSNGKPIEAVSLISNNKQITLTDPKGDFKIFESIKNICFHSFGYKDTCVIVDNQKFLKIVLEEDITYAEEIIVKSNQGRIIQGTQTGFIELRSEQMKHLPSLTGEADLLKILQFTPGVSKSDVSMGLNVRGSSTDQNLVLFDGATVYNPTHLAGFLSVFNSQIVEKVSLMKSGIPANYGGRLSSVTEVSGRSKIPDSSELYLNSGILMSNISLSIPVKKNIGFYIAARKSYIDYTLKPLTQYIIKKLASSFRNTNYGFYDLNAGFQWKNSDNDWIYASFYMGNDDYQLQKASFDLENNINWQNIAFSSRWMHYFSSNYIMKSRLSYSKNNFNIDMGQNDFFFKMNSYLQDYNFQNEHQFYFQKWNLKAGAELLFQHTEPNQSKANLNDLKIDFGTTNIFKTLTCSPYLSSEINITSSLLFSAGIRASYYVHYGPYDQFLRDGQKQIVDTLHYSKNAKVKDYFFLEPRFSARYLLNKKSSLKLSVTRNIQYLHQVNVSAVSFPTDFWLPSSGVILPQKAWQYSVGYFYESEEKELNVSAEVFYKEMKNQIEFASGILTSVTRSSMEENLLFGKGRSYGLELFFQKSIQKFNGWISYTLSRTEKIFSEINDGKPFPAKYDRTHDLSVLGSYRFNNRWKFSAEFVYTTGSAMTLPTGRYMVGSNIINQYSGYNSFRMPAYHRLDIAASRELKSQGKYQHRLNFGLYNLYNHINPYYMYFSVNGDLKRYQFTVKPKYVSLYSILPSISYELNF